jgi:glucokinase
VILAGDIGGTKVQLALFDERGRRRQSRSYPSRQYPSLEAVLSEYLRGVRARVDRACFGVAGPVVGGRSETPNLPWIIDEKALSEAVGIDQVRLLNDLEAMAAGVLRLGRRDLVALHPGRRKAQGNAAVIAAGTGLGEAVLVWDGERHHPCATEGGHADFAPRDREEFALLEYLRRDYDRVSYERVVSGPGLLNVYRFLRDTGRGREPRWLGRALAQGDPSATVSHLALEKKSPLCVQALEMFASLYGAETGNLALRSLALSGVFLGGGIAPQILPQLQDGAFLRSFFDKGRMRPLLERVPVYVILNRAAPLIGAAHFAAGL